MSSYLLDTHLEDPSFDHDREVEPPIVLVVVVVVLVVPNIRSLVAARNDVLSLDGCSRVELLLQA